MKLPWNVQITMIKNNVIFYKMPDMLLFLWVFMFRK